MKVYSSPADLVNREARDRTAAKIEKLLPLLTEGQRTIFDRILVGLGSDDLTSLQIKDLKSLLSLVERTIDKERKST